MTDGPRLRLVPPPNQVTLGAVSVTMAEQPPFPTQATVYEEDTYLVLSADLSLRPPGAHPLRVINSAYATEPLPPGTVQIGSGEPLPLLAVIHDLDCDPSCRAEWVTLALEGILDLCQQRRIKSLALPLLGTVHRALSMGAAAELLGAVLATNTTHYLERIWLEVADLEQKLVSTHLRRATPP